MNESSNAPEKNRLEPLAVDAAGVGHLLCVSRATVFQLDSCGRLPRPVRLGKRCPRWIVSELHEWLRAGAPNREAWEQLNARSATLRGNRVQVC